MAKKNHTLGKFLALTTTIAAIGGTCYVFRKQIKESSIYKKSSDKISTLIKKVSEKVCPKDEESFCFDEDDEDFYSDTMFSEDAKKNREYTSITINSKDATDTTENSDVAESIPETISNTAAEDISETFSDTNVEDISEITSSTYAEDSSETSEETKTEDMKAIFPDESIPTISFGTDFSTSSSSEAPVFNTTDDSSSESEEVIAYENEGLSDVSEDPDVLEEQDKLDF